MHAHLSFSCFQKKKKIRTKYFVFRVSISPRFSHNFSKSTAFVFMAYIFLCDVLKNLDTYSFLVTWLLVSLFGKSHFSCLLFNHCVLLLWMDVLEIESLSIWLETFIWFWGFLLKLLKKKCLKIFHYYWILCLELRRFPKSFFGMLDQEHCQEMLRRKRCLKNIKNLF